MKMNKTGDIQILIGYFTRKECLFFVLLDGKNFQTRKENVLQNIIAPIKLSSNSSTLQLNHKKFYNFDFLIPQKKLWGERINDRFANLKNLNVE